MNLRLIFLVFFCTNGILVRAQTPFLDSIVRPDFVAWEYQLEEIVVEGDQGDNYNTALRYHKSDPLSSGDEVMEKLVGIWAIKRGNYALEPVIRGLSAGQINVTIDGMRMLGACTDKMDPVTSYVEPNNLKELKASIGSGGFESGSTVGGSYDMQIKKPALNAENPWGGSFGSRLLSANNGLEALFNTSYYDGKKFALLISAAYRKAEDYRAGGGAIIDHSAYNKVNYSASATLLQKRGGQLNFSYIGDNGWDIGYPALVMDVGSAKAHIAAVTLETPLNGKVFNQLSSKVYYNRVLHVMDDTHRDVVMHMDMPGNTTTYGAFMKGYYNLGKKLSGETKADFYHSAAYAEMTMYPDESAPMYMLTWPDIHRNVVGINNQNTWNFSKSAALLLGFRIENNKAEMRSELGERQFSVFNYGTPTGSRLLLNANLGIKQSFMKYFSVKASTSIGERMPTESEQFGFYLYNVYDGYDYMGRTNLEPEKSLQGEITVEYLRNSTNFSVTGFYYHFSQYIMGRTDPSLSPMTIGANGVKVYENLPSALLAGAETQFSLGFGRFELLNMAKVVYGQTANNEPLPLIPPFKDNLNLALHAGQTWHIYAEMEASSAQNRVNDAFGETPTPGYWIANARIEKTFPVKISTIKVSAAIDNILDTEYHEHLDWGSIPRMGRNIQLSVYVSY